LNRLGTVQRRLLYSTFALLAATGAYWALIHYAGVPAWLSEPLLMKVHGAAAMLALMLVGGLLQAHVPAGWKEARQRSSGGAMLAVFGLLALSGYLLYYAGGESLRNASSYLHLALGLALPAALCLHLSLKSSRQPPALAAASQPFDNPKELAEWNPTPIEPAPKR
jgi:hypothetical protein